MMRKLLFFCLFFFTLSTAFSQIRTVSGTVIDQQGKLPLSKATVKLNSLTDSAFVKTTLSDSLGRFIFTDLAPDSFLLSVSYSGYNAILRRFRLDTLDLSLNIAAAPSSSQALETVVITTTVSPVSQKGDTLQMSASQYKVNPDASVEDLVKKMPGITIEDGVVKAQGENVQKVTIDGRELFGDDATAALRNLPAEVVDKIQVFDRLSDQAQFSGVDDGNTTKAINIITKVGMRNGQFGRVYAGYGTDDRYNIGGNTTLMHENRKISIAGILNNVNQQNFAAQDLLGVTSSQNNRGGGGGGGNRGGGGGGGRGAGGAGGGGGNFGGGNNFQVGQQNGINKTNSIGINYSDIWGKKLTFTGSYFFNNVGNTTAQTTNAQAVSDGVPDYTQVNSSRSNNNNHRVNMRFDYKIDSANQLLITPSFSTQSNSTTRDVDTKFYTDLAKSGSLLSETDNRTTSNRSGNNFNNSILYRHAFPKRGRTFSISLNTAYNKRNSQSYIDTRQVITATSFDSTTSRFSDQVSDGTQLSANFSYTEPIGKQSQFQVNYNPSVSKSNSDQETYNFNAATQKYSMLIDSLTNRFQNKTTAQNGGFSYRWGNRDRMISFGVNFQNTALMSDQLAPKTLSVDKSFNNVLPNAMAQYKISTRSSVRLFYRTNVNQPSVTQLQNVVDITNQPFYTAGNPDLKQQYGHIVNTRYTYTNVGKGLLFNANIFYQSTNDYITNAVYAPSGNRTVTISGIRLRAGEQLTKPVNVNGYSSLRSFLTFAIPVKFIKSNINFNTGFNFVKQPGLINDTINLTKSKTWSAGTVIGSNISQYVDFTVSYSADFNDVQSKTVNESYFQHRGSVQLTLLSKKGYFFQNDLTNQLYTGLTAGNNQNYFLWNMSVGKKLFKSQRGEIRASVFDLLQQNQSISRVISESYVSDIRNVVLQRYFMLTFTYNLRNFGKVSANNNRGDAEPRRDFNSGGGFPGGGMRPPGM